MGQAVRLEQVGGAGLRARVQEHMHLQVLGKEGGGRRRGAGRTFVEHGVVPPSQGRWNRRLDSLQMSVLKSFLFFYILILLNFTKKLLLNQIKKYFY